MRFSNNKSSKKLWINLGRFQVFFALYKKPTIATQGITNETEDGMYVPFVDYDGINLDKVYQEANRIIKRWGLSGLCVIATKENLTKDGDTYGNYHLVGFDKLKFHEHLDLLRDTCCDRNFIRVPQFFRYKHWVLRVAPKYDDHSWRMLKDKPYIKCWIKGVKNGLRSQSKGHYQFMRKYYGLMPLKLNWDAGEGIKIINYNTTST